MLLFCLFFYYFVEEKNNPNPMHFSEEWGSGPRFIINFFVSICTVLL